MTLMSSQNRSILAVALAVLVAMPGSAQDPSAPKQLNIVIVEGEGAVNNARQRVSREPIVQVTDENNKPVAGAAVVFFLPSNGPGAVFPGGANSFTAITGVDGKAAANGLKANSLQGDYQVRVTASSQGRTASSTINMRNKSAAISAVAIWLIILLCAGGVAAGILLTRDDSQPVRVMPGTPVVTPPR